MQLAIQGVSKKYGRSVWGLRDFTLDVRPGVLGLLGPNGAGKSTLMRILATVTRPTQGSVAWNGADVLRSPDSVRSVLGYLPQDFGVYPHLNAVEFLEYLAAVKGASILLRRGTGSKSCYATHPKPARRLRRHVVAAAFSSPRFRSPNDRHEYAPHSTRSALRER